MWDEANRLADLTRGIIAIQTRLIHLAAAKTTALNADASRAKPREARALSFHEHLDVSHYNRR